MTYEVIGIKTKRVYAKGSKPECMRVINKNNPYKVSGRTKDKFGAITDDSVFKEPLRIIRRNNHEALG